MKISRVILLDTGDEETIIDGDSINTTKLTSSEMETLFMGKNVTHLDIVGRDYSLIKDGIYTVEYFIEWAKSVGD